MYKSITVARYVVKFLRVLAASVIIKANIISSCDSEEREIE